MQLATLQRYGGMALSVGAMLLTVYSVLFVTCLPIQSLGGDSTPMILDPQWLPATLSALAGLLFLIFGFIAVYSRIYDRTGRTGLFGFVTILLAFLQQASKVTWEVCLFPLIANHPVASVLLRERLLQQYPNVAAFKICGSVLILLGVLFFSWAILRSRAFPRSAGPLVFVGAVIYGLGPMYSFLMAVVGIVIFAAGCLQIGLALMRPENRA